MNQIDYSKLRNLTAREIINALKHSGNTFATGTLKRMIKDQAKWTLNDSRRLKLVSRKTS